MAKIENITFCLKHEVPFTTGVENPIYINLETTDFQVFFGAINAILQYKKKQAFEYTIKIQTDSVYSSTALFYGDQLPRPLKRKIKHKIEKVKREAQNDN